MPHLSMGVDSKSHVTLKVHGRLSKLVLKAFFLLITCVVTEQKLPKMLFSP